MTDPRNLADWLEMRSFISKDRRASFADLRRAISTAGDGGSTHEDETLAAAAFDEIRDRYRACRKAYPFRIDGRLLIGPRDASPFWAYLFCLWLSLNGADRGDAESHPTRIFEEVAEIAAKKYIDGRAMKFGFPRRVLPSPFIDALQLVCSEVGEGNGAKRRPDSKHEKDGKLDIIAWKPFPDKRVGKVILFGQCAAGGNWSEKLNELQPEVFTDLYWTDAPAVSPVKAFFTPFRLAHDNWYKIARSGGIPFDRCRISHWTFGEGPPPGLKNWSRSAVRKLSE